MELSGLNTDYSTLAVEMQSKIASESDLLSAGFPDNTIVLLSNTLAGITAMLNYSQVTRDLNNFTPFAFLKSAGYAIASTLGVSPARKRGAQQTVLFTSGDNNLDFSNQLDVPLTVPAYTQFACRNTIFHTREDYVINQDDTSVQFQLYEGVLNSVSFVSTGEKFQRWLVGTQYNVDQHTVRVLIDNEFWISGNGTFVKYLGNDKVFIPTTSPDGKVLILFGNGLYGVVPPNGSVIKVLYTITVGSQGNSASVGDPVSLMDIIQISSGLALTLTGNTITVASGGMDEEDLDSIKYVTPRLYASNERSVRRDDYIGQMLGANCPVAMADARAWGEYEQARLVGLGTVEMMNRAFWGGVLATMAPSVNTSSAPTGASRFGYTLYHPDDPSASPPRPIPGSLVIRSTDPALVDTVFSDQDGYGILTSPLVKANYFSTPGITVNSTSNPGTVGVVIDGSPDTKWQSVDIPSITNPVFIMVTLPVTIPPGQIPASYRLRASDDISVDHRAFPSSISIWGSNNPTSPSMVDQTLWIPIRGNVYPPDPGVEGPTRWYSLNNKTPYKYLLFQINDRYGNGPYVKISEIELQILPQSSTINYDTAAVVVDYRTTTPAAGTSIITEFYGDNLSPGQQEDIQNFILDTNHFTTQFTYSSARMVRADLSLQVYYNPAYSRNTVLNNISKSLGDLLKVSKGSISRSRKFSDLTGAVISVKGVDYCVFVNPPNGSNFDCEIDQYVYLTSLTVEMILSDR